MNPSFRFIVSSMSSHMLRKNETANVQAVIVYETTDSQKRQSTSSLQFIDIHKWLHSYVEAIM